LIKAIDHLRFEQHALFLEELKRKKVKDAEDELGDIFADLPKLQEALNKQIIIRELTSADASATSAAAAAPAPAVAPALANAHKPSFRDSKHVAPASLGSSAVAGSMNDATLIAHVADAKKMPKTFDSMTTEEIIEQINDQMTAWENDKDKLASLLFINNILKEGVKNYELNRVVSGMPTQFLQFQNSIICALEEIVEKSVRISTEEIIKTEEVLHQISVLSSQWNKNFAQDILLCSRGTCALEKLKTRANMPIAAASASTVAMLEHFQTGAIVAAGAKTNNKKAAVKRYREEAEQNHAEAQYQLGLCYENGGGVIQNRKEAVKWYRKAAEQGHAAAQHKLGVCYAESIGVASDEGIAVDWYRKAAEQGYAAAQHKLGLCYAEGRGGVARDKRVAVEWHRKAAEQGYAAAQYGLGFCYERGRGIEQDLSIAIELYGKAAEQGYPLAAAAQAILNNTFRNSR
jgi:TPR repeat protein